MSADQEIRHETVMPRIVPAAFQIRPEADAGFAPDGLVEIEIDSHVGIRKKLFGAGRLNRRVAEQFGIHDRTKHKRAESPRVAGAIRPRRRLAQRP